MGSRREALMAGSIPLTTPTNPRIMVDASRVVESMVRWMSPSVPFSIKALHKVSDPTDQETM
jgi:hypothetical protein